VDAVAIYLYTAFKKIVGYSPSAYRNLLLENKETIG
jgi:YesN/AraC family two-component response regulator